MVLLANNTSAVSPTFSHRIVRSVDHQSLTTLDSSLERCHTFRHTYAIPFPDNKFDLVTAVETQYYWPDLLKEMQEILRVLKPGGTLLVIAESYAKGSRATRFLNFARLSVVEHRGLFTAAGYQNVQVFEKSDKGWLSALGVKPHRTGG